MKFIRFMFILVLALSVVYILLHKMNKTKAVIPPPSPSSPVNRVMVVEEPEDPTPACTFLYPQKTHFRGSLNYKNGIPILVAEGTPSEIGDQVGVLAVLPARDAHSYPRQMFEQHAHYRRFVKNIIWRKLMTAGEQLLANSPSAYRTEFNQIARRINRENLLAGNTLFDIKNEYDIQLACSSIAVLPERSGTGGLLFGRNLDYPSGGYLHNYAMVIVYKPTGKRAFAAVSYPGVIGCLTGMNEAGVCVAVLEVKALKQGTTKFTTRGVPYAFCYRRILEECSSVDDARRLLPSLNIDTANSLAICDTRTACVFEMTPDGFAERPSENGACCCANHFVMERFRPAVEPSTNSIVRLESLRKAASKDRLGIADIQQALDDVCSQETTLQTIVFEPSQLTMHVGVGVIPSTKAKLRKINLSKVLKP